MQPNANNQYQIPAGAPSERVVPSKQETAALAAVREVYDEDKPVAEIVQPFAEKFVRLENMYENLKLVRDQYINDRLPQ